MDKSLISEDWLATFPQSVTSFCPQISLTTRYAASTLVWILQNLEQNRLNYSVILQNTQAFDSIKWGFITRF